MSEPSPPSRVSPDGKYYWDGTQWMPTQSQAPSQPRSGVVAKLLGGALNNWVGYGCLAVAAVVVLVAVTAWCASPG
jgi:hypothetical protein